MHLLIPRNVRTDGDIYPGYFWHQPPPGAAKFLDPIHLFEILEHEVPQLMDDAEKRGYLQRYFNTELVQLGISDHDAFVRRIQRKQQLQYKQVIQQHREMMALPPAEKDPQRHG